MVNDNGNNILNDIIMNDEYTINEILADNILITTMKRSPVMRLLYLI